MQAKSTSIDTVPRFLRSPGDEGYRTPTIEDVERQRNRPDVAIPQASTRSYFDTGLGQPAETHEGPITNGETSSQKIDDEEFADALPWRIRLKHLTWAFFTFTMATGGIANVLYSVPYRFRGLTVIGDMFFLGNLVAYIIIWILICFRFYFHPHTFKASFLHPTESLFIPAAAVSFGTILINISQYGLHHVGDWLNNVVEVLFWFDATLAVVLSISIYLLLWSTQYFSVSRMTPIWIFPAYPLLIIGPHAGILSGQLSSGRALPIIIGGFTIQGVGFLVSLMVYSAFIYRLMTQKLPRESLRPGMFVSVGPSGFTVAGTVNMAKNAKNIMPALFMGDTDPQLTATIIKVCANWMSLWLWGLAIWFFFVSVLAHLTAFIQGTGSDDGDLPVIKSAIFGPTANSQDSPNTTSDSSRSPRRRWKKPQMSFSMTFFSFVFPNTALVTATFAIGGAFKVPAINVIGCVMTCLLILTWLFVVVGMIRAIRNHVILWPEKGEDRDEGGFKKSQVSGGDESSLRRQNTRGTVYDDEDRRSFRDYDGARGPRYRKRGWSFRQGNRPGGVMGRNQSPQRHSTIETSTERDGTGTQVEEMV